MRYIEWLVLFVIAACGTGLANLIGYGVGFGDSIPGLVVLIVISMVAVVLTKVLPLKLPIVAYCSIHRTFKRFAYFTGEGICDPGSGQH